MRRAGALLAALALAGCGLGPAGCGFGEGEEREGGASVRITRDFGHSEVGAVRVARVREDQTVMKLLQSEFDVDTRFGGRFVQAIDGIEGEGAGGQMDWFFFVNGVEAGVGAAEYELSPGDRVQWDYRDWSATMRVPAIVGAFPEPFLHGVEGERLPTRVECDDDQSPACDQVKDSLGEAGVTATGAPLGAPAGEEVLRVVVAPWDVTREVQAARPIQEGPAQSGVFARFSPEGEELALLDEEGNEAATLGPGAGLIAAVELSTQQPVWLVTGVDEAGVEAAAEALDEEALADAFAVAVPPGDEPLKLPMVDGDS